MPPCGRDFSGERTDSKEGEWGSLREGASLQARENNRTTALVDTLRAFSKLETAGMDTPCQDQRNLDCPPEGTGKTAGFTPRQAEWITLVCLYSGLFTRHQVEAFLGSSQPTASRFVQRLLDTRLSDRPIVRDLNRDGRRICHLFAGQIYRRLEIPYLRHRRETPPEVTRRRLLSLDVVLDHPEVAWLETEQEKVACFEQMGIGADLLPRRIYAGRARGRVQYFPLRLPVAVEPERAVFVYIDPGMGTRSELDYRGAAHHSLWNELRERGRRVEVVAIAWEQKHLDRIGRRLEFWRVGGKGEDSPQAAFLRQDLADAERDTAERHGGLNVVMEKIDQLGQETPACNGRALIDDFRPWGSRTWRTRMAI